MYLHLCGVEMMLNACKTNVIIVCDGVLQKFGKYLLKIIRLNL